MLARLQFRLPVPVNSKDPPEGTLPKGAGTTNRQHYSLWTMMMFDNCPSELRTCTVNICGPGM
jgi:hypothetical protein